MVVPGAARQPPPVRPAARAPPRPRESPAARPSQPGACPAGARLAAARQPVAGRGDSAGTSPWPASLSPPTARRSPACTACRTRAPQPAPFLDRPRAQTDIAARLRPDVWHRPYAFACPSLARLRRCHAAVARRARPSRPAGRASLPGGRCAALDHAEGDRDKGHGSDGGRGASGDQHEARNLPRPAVPVAVDGVAQNVGLGWRVGKDSLKVSAVAHLPPRTFPRLAPRIPALAAPVNTCTIAHGHAALPDCKPFRLSALCRGALAE